VELNLRVGLSSEAGPVRELNEDYAAYHVPDDAASPRARGSIFLVADGMGGHQAGEVASREAVTRALQEYLTDDTREPGNNLRRAIRLANRWLYEEAQTNRATEGMGTTLVAAVIRGCRVFIANVGDSRAYVVNRTGITQITEDHSWVEEQVQAGVLTRVQAERHPQRNLITRALGHRPTVEVDLFEGEMLPGDTLLLCTDGVCGPLSEEAMAIAVRDQDPALSAAALVAQAGVAGGEDNATALVVRALPSGSAQREDEKATVAVGARRAELSWIGNWIHGPGLLRLGVRRQHLAVGLASAISFLCLCLALVLLPGVSQSLFQNLATAPQVAPLRDDRLVGSSPEQMAGYLGYLDEADMVSAHPGLVNWANMANADLWPATPKLFLAGTARSWKCEAGDCVFVIRMADTDRSVYYPTVTDGGPSLDGRLVRVLGSQQGEKPGLMAEFIERGRDWWAWWQPAWQIVYPGDLWNKTIWVYGAVDPQPNGLLEPKQSLDLDRGSQVLVRGQWIEGRRSSVLNEEQVYKLQGDRYGPVSGQELPIPQPTVTLQPTPAE
jgi:serine/threonine protein phosphatase PrpC